MMQTIYPAKVLLTQIAMTTNISNTINKITNALRIITAISSTNNQVTRAVTATTMLVTSNRVASLFIVLVVTVKRMEQKIQKNLSLLKDLFNIWNDLCDI